MSSGDRRLKRYLAQFERDRLQRNRYRNWCLRDMELRLAPNVFPSDSPLSLTTSSMLETLELESHVLTERKGIGVEIGTGNGALAIFLSRLAPNCRLVAVDIELSALASARWNVRHLGATSVSVVGGNLFSALHCSLDVIVATLPFIQELGGDGLLEEFWCQSALRARRDTLVYFSWIEWLDFSKLEAVAEREGFGLLRWYQFRRDDIPCAWRVYVFTWPGFRAAERL